MSRGSRDRRTAAWIALVVTLALCPFLRGHFESTDELGVFLTTQALAERGTLEVPPIRHVYPGRDGRRYSQYAIGQSVLAVPLYAAGSLAESVLPESVSRAMAGPGFRWQRHVFPGSVAMTAVGLYGPILTGLLAAVFFLFQRHLGTGHRAAAGAALLVALTTYLATQSTFFLRHTTESLLVLAAFFAFHAHRRGAGLGTLALGSALASAILLVRLPGGISGIPLAGYLAFVLWERHAPLAPGGGLRCARALGAVAAPFLVAAALHVGLDLYKWGSLGGTPMMVAGVFDTPLRESLTGFLVSPGISLFVYSPLLLLAPLLAANGWRSHRAEVLTATGLLVCLLAFYAPYEGWTGLWSAPGPRYLVGATAPLLLFLGRYLEGPPWHRRVVFALALLGVCVQLPFVLTYWGGLITTSGWSEYEPTWGFLFVAADSPLAAALRALLRGEFHPWIVRILTPRGAVHAPGVGVTLLLLWAVALGGAIAGLRRSLRASADPGEPVKVAGPQP